MEVKERIRQKAHDLFMQYGVRSVTMDDIAAALGISKKTLYQFYADKDELVEAVMGDIIEFNQSSCLRDKQTAKDAIHEVFLAIEMMQEMFRDMNPSILYELQKYHSKAFEKFLQHKHTFMYKVFVENIERGIKEELFRPDVNIEILVKTRLETIMLAFNQAVFPKSKYRLIDVETELTEHYLFSLATLKGHKQIEKYKQERTKKYQRNEKISA
jgi:TetR/AcrR family transcriptional regulator, cholesterol catabolism regulator